MSDAAAASSSARYIRSEPPDNAAPQQAAQQEGERRRKQNRQMFNKKRGELLDDFLRNLDILVYAELSAIYYMDCSFLRLLLRGGIHFLLLTPKPSILPPSPMANGPAIGPILGVGLLCMLMHLLLDAPSAGEATREYLHGGLAMDFIGQKGPSSKLHLLILDFVVLAFQIVQLSAHVVRTGLKEREGLTVTTANGRQYAAPAPEANTQRQDLDSEERGMRRSEEGDEIEMRTLDPSGSAAANATVPTETANDEEDEDDERAALLAQPAPSSSPSSASPPARTDAHIFDAFNSGQIVLADLDLWQALKQQFLSYSEKSEEDSMATGRMLRDGFRGQVTRLRLGPMIARGIRAVAR